jgi:hypothetical protein
VTFADLAKRLTARAATAASAHAELALRARRKDERRWHHARLLWPDFVGRITGRTR